MTALAAPPTAAAARSAELARDWLSWRAAIAIGEAARAHALLDGKPNAGFDDVRAVAGPAMAHRIVLDYKARMDGVDGRSVVEAILEGTPEMAEELPAELEGGRA